jgi:hypothetical protein
VTTASFSTTALSVNAHTITASYNGDSKFTSSSTSLSQTVNKASTSTVVSSSLNPAFFGQTVTFTATISVTLPGTGTPTGTVQFQFDGSNVGSPATVGTSGGVTTASFSTSTLAVGPHAVAAIYSGDGSFATSTGSLSGGQTIKPNGVAAASNTDTGLLSISGDTGNNVITIKQIAPGVIRVSGDAVAPPAVPTKVNGTTSADFSSINAISLQFLGGNDRVTVTGFSLSGDLSLIAGSGSDTFTLDTLTANRITLTATGPDSVSVNHATVKKQLSISVGAGSHSIAVLNTTSLDMSIQAHSALGDAVNFDLEHDQITDSSGGGLTLNDASGGGNDMVNLSNLTVTYGLAVTLGGGINTLSADHVTALFGFIDGGHPNSGGNNYVDGGNNLGYYVFDFAGY